MKVASFNQYLEKRERDNLVEMEASDVSAKVLKIKKRAENDFQIVYVDKKSGSNKELKAQKRKGERGTRSLKTSSVEGNRRW